MSQDIIERLREYKDILYPEAHEAADTIESLRARVAELEALCSENNGIIQRMGIGIKDKDRLIAQLVRDAEMYGPNKLAIEKQAWVMADSVREIRELRDQLAAQALTIKTMREALEKFIDSHEECTDFDGFTAQIVSMDDYHEAQEAISLPDNSTEVLQAWLDKQLGEPVAFKDKEARNRVIFPPAKPEANDARWDALYRKPEIK